MKSNSNQPLQPSPTSLALLKLLEEGFVVVFSTRRVKQGSGLGPGAAQGCAGGLGRSAGAAEAGGGDLTAARTVTGEIEM